MDTFASLIVIVAVGLIAYGLYGLARNWLAHDPFDPDDAA